MPDVERDGLVINRGLESHLVIYTRREWNKIMDELSRLNQFERKSREFIRKFMRGASELTLDASGRVLIPKSLQAYADRSEEHTSELQSLMRISYAVFCLIKKKKRHNQNT